MSLPQAPERPITDSSNRDSTIKQSFTVKFEYPVHFTHDVLHPQNPVLADCVSRTEPERIHRVIFMVDGGLMEAQPDLPGRIERYIASHPASLEIAGPLVRVPGGEAAKNTPDIIKELHSKLLRAGIDRQSYVISIGGGAVLDLTGFVAATFHRGVRHIRVPSTVLSQNDSGVGVKNGINSNGVKNLVGSFSPPFAVINDSKMLLTLDNRDKRSGIAEAIKVSLIRDPEFFHWLETNAPGLATFDTELQDEMIRRCARLHMEHIASCGDPFERANSRPLDFGHWAAHKLEQLTGYNVRHGEAVAIGLALDTRYSAEIGLIRNGDCERVVTLLETLGFQTWHHELTNVDKSGHTTLLDGLREFREHLGGDFSITLLSAIGTMTEVQSMDESIIRSACTWLEQRNSQG